MTEPRAKYVLAQMIGPSRFVDVRRYRKRELALQRAQERSISGDRMIVWNERIRGTGIRSREATATFEAGRCLFDEASEIINDLGRSGEETAPGLGCGNDAPTRCDSPPTVEGAAQKNLSTASTCTPVDNSTPPVPVDNRPEKAGFAGEWRRRESNPRSKRLSDAGGGS